MHSRAFPTNGEYSPPHPEPSASSFGLLKVGARTLDLFERVSNAFSGRHVLASAVERFVALIAEHLTQMGIGVVQLRDSSGRIGVGESACDGGGFVMSESLEQHRKDS